MWQGIGIIIAFIIVAVLMITRKIPTLAALPLLAVLVCVIAGVPAMSEDVHGTEIGFFTTVIEGGAIKLASAYCAVIFGAWLGQLLNRTGITETIIKKAAEFGGDRPLLSVFLLSLITALLFIVLSGLGSIIMVGTIILPIMLSLGISAEIAACIFLFAFGAGLTLNIANWQVFVSIFNLSVKQISNFEIVMAVATVLGLIVFVLLNYKKKSLTKAFAAPASTVQNTSKISGWRVPFAFLTPLIPIVLVMVFKMPIIISFSIAICWSLIFTQTKLKNAMNTLAKTCYDGISDSAPAIILMIGIGMLYLSVTQPQVKVALTPIISAITPTVPIAFVIFFIVLAPLALYRGPLNLFGLGSGIAALMAGTGLLSPLSVMGGFLSAERVQCIADPTNTQNVWIANFVGVDVNNLTKKLLPYVWAVTAVGAIYASVVYM